jgi:K+-transporting ATPase KdpF subunit
LKELHHVGLHDSLDRRHHQHAVVAIASAVRPLDGREAMNGSELIGLLLSVGLLVYLTIAMLKPEWFA